MILAAAALPLVPALPASAASRPPVAAAGAASRHPLGFQFALPAGWRVEKGEDGNLQLLPGDPHELEMLVLTTDSAQGITRIDDPRIVPLVETDLAQLFSFLARVGEPEPVRTGLGPGRRLTWEGTSPTGVEVRAQVYLVLFGERAVALVAVGPKAPIMARGAALRTGRRARGSGASSPAAGRRSWRSSPMARSRSSSSSPPKTARPS